MSLRKWRVLRNRTSPLRNVLLVLGPMILFLLVLLKELNLSSSTPRAWQSPSIHNRRWMAPTLNQKYSSQSLPPLPLLPKPDIIDVQSPPSACPPAYLRENQGSITAVLPVTADSINDLNANLESIVAGRPSFLYEIIVACHPKITGEAEQAVTKARRFLTTPIFITVLPWDHKDTTSLGILHILPSVSTRRVLLLDITALCRINESTRLVLLDSIPSDFPLGPHGVLISPSDVSCIHSGRHPVPAAYLFPPFLAPTSSLVQAENGMSLDANTWAALGERIIKTKRTGFGGMVFSTSSTNNRCMDAMATSRETVPSPAFLQSFYELLEQGADDRSSFVPRLIILLPGRDELERFGSSACEMTHRGYTLRIILFSWTGANPSSHFALDAGCHLHFEAISQDSILTLANRLKASIQADKLDVVMYASENAMQTMAIEASLAALRLVGGTIVRIPVADLPFCEWMATLGVSEWQNWHKPRIDLSVITNDRPRSLLRLLGSLTAARYYGDAIQMKINLEQTADTETRQIATGFDWKPGIVHVQHRIISAGLLPAVVEAWYPYDNDSYGVLLEDDVEVSPLFYAWIKMAILRYRYGPLQSRVRSIFGVSLYQPANLELRVEGRVPFDARLLFSEHNLPDVRTPYLSQVPCSWGAVYFPEHFREFHDYLALRLSEVTHNISEVIVPDIRSNRWTRSWKKYFNELVYLRGYVMLYPNYNLSLATNHVEIGAHVKNDPENIPDAVRRQYDIPLMPLPSISAGSRAVSLLDMPGGSLPVWDELPVLDLWGFVTPHQEILRRGYERHELLSGCPSLKELAQFTHDAGELLCLRPPDH